MDNSTYTKAEGQQDFSMDDLRAALEKLYPFPDDDDTVMVYVRRQCYKGKLTEGPLGHVMHGMTHKGERFALIIFQGREIL